MATKCRNLHKNKDLLGHSKKIIKKYNIAGIMVGIPKDTGTVDGIADTTRRVSTRKSTSVTWNGKILCVRKGMYGIHGHRRVGEGLQAGGNTGKRVAKSQNSLLN